MGSNLRRVGTVPPSDLDTPGWDVYEDQNWVVCPSCGGEGVLGHECGDDCCACADPEDNLTCDTCNGEGGWVDRSPGGG